MNLQSRFIKGDWCQSLLEALIGEGYTVFAPIRDGDIVRFRQCTSGAEVVRDRINTHYPLKEVFFPMTEPILQYQFCPGEDETFSASASQEQKIAVFGCRPCDASSLAILDLVFNWDYQDSLYNSRRKNSLVISVGCTESDDKCFCSSVGLGPDSTDGSDILIQNVGEKGAVVTLCSEKGSAFVAAHKDMFVDVPRGVSVSVADVPVKVDVERVKPWLDEHFDDDFWKEVVLGCLGCGACSYLCPTCHCFDVVDESDWQEGERRRNYDCCSYALFTLHASGHNPRPTPAARWRNRLMHKFRYFVERFDRRACVGCGRCMRLCGAGQNLIDMLKSIADKEKQLTTKGTKDTK